MTHVEVATTAELLDRRDWSATSWQGGRLVSGPVRVGTASARQPQHLADPRRAEMKDIVNTKIKFREPYRPFAPSVLAESAGKYFDLDGGLQQYPPRYMLFVTPVKPEHHATLPATTHVDGTARLQTVYRERIRGTTGSLSDLARPQRCAGAAEYISSICAANRSSPLREMRQHFLSKSDGWSGAGKLPDREAVLVLAVNQSHLS